MSATSQAPRIPGSQPVPDVRRRRPRRRRRAILLILLLLLAATIGTGIYLATQSALKESMPPTEQMVSNTPVPGGFPPAIFATPTELPPAGIAELTHPVSETSALPTTTNPAIAPSLVTRTPLPAGSLVGAPWPTSASRSAPALRPATSPVPSGFPAQSTTNIPGIPSVTPVNPTATPAAPSALPTPGMIALASDHNGIPVLQMFNMVPGDRSHGSLTLSNVGSLVLDYGLQVKGGSGPLWTDPVNGLQLKITRLADNLVLYQGPLAATTGPIGQLAPGEQVLLELEVRLPTAADNQFQSQAVSVDFDWIATQPL